MASYYYLVSQLPHLLYDQKPPMSSSAFLELTIPLLDAKDAAFLKHLSLDPGLESGGDSYAASTGCQFVDDWRNWERVLRLNLAKHRSIKNKLDNANVGEPPVVPADAAAASVKAVNSAAHPLEGEVFIDKARWDAIGALAGTDYFDRNVVFAYYLKLMLLERRQSFDTEKGFTEYKSLYSSILEGAAHMGEPK